MILCGDSLWVCVGMCMRCNRSSCRVATGCDSCCTVCFGYGWVAMHELEIVNGLNFKLWW